jgi:hypothetical protein
MKECRRVILTEVSPHLRFPADFFMRMSKPFNLPLTVILVVIGLSIDVAIGIFIASMI